MKAVPEDENDDDVEVDVGLLTAFTPSFAYIERKSSGRGHKSNEDEELEEALENAAQRLAQRVVDELFELPAAAAGGADGNATVVGVGARMVTMPPPIGILPRMKPVPDDGNKGASKWLITIVIVSSSRARARGRAGVLADAGVATNIIVLASTACLVIVIVIVS